MEEEEFKLPETLTKKSVPHYYGDSMRVAFIATAILYAVAMPIWGNLLPFGDIAGIATVLLLVLFAGITNPHSKFVMLLDVLFSGLGVFLLQAAAISFYTTDSAILFILRETAVVLLLFAFYYSVKSFRSMILGNIGAEGTPGEFEKKK